MYKKSKNEGWKRIALILLIGFISLGLLLPSFMSLLWGFGQ